jgi:hypothetical protein
LPALRKMTGLSRDERGQGQAISLIFAVLFLAMLLGLGVFVAHVQPVKVAVHAAARNCARMAVATLSEGRGPDQGYAAAYQTMASQNLDVGGLEVIFEHGAWGRGETIVCRVRYSVAVDWMPFISLFFEGRGIPLEGVSMLRIEPYKSRWGD